MRVAHVDGVEERALRDVSLLRGHVRCAQAVAAVQHLAWDSRCRRTGRGSRRCRGQKGLSTIASCSRLEIRTGPTPTRSARIPTYKYSTFTVLCIQAPVAATCTCVVVILHPPFPDVPRTEGNQQHTTQSRHATAVAAHNSGACCPTNVDVTHGAQGLR